MAIIGQFTRNPDGTFTGVIITLSVQAQNVRILPESTASSSDDVSHRIMVGSAHLGDAWPATGANLRLELDDPSFAAPITAELLEQPDGTFAVIWRR